MIALSRAAASPFNAPMTAAALEVEPVPTAPHSLRDDPEALEVATAKAEHSVLHDGVVGAIIGAIVLAPTWALLVLLALRNSGTALTPPALMAAGVGVIAGVFMGGWAGTLVGSQKLEHFEHETRPPAP